MKVGILTWYDVRNYGSVFQAYALQEYIKQLGHDCVILQHDRAKTLKLPEKTKVKTIKDALKWIRNQTPNRKLNKKSELDKQNSFEVFRTKYLSIGDSYDRESNLDCVIIGSDQIFDIKYFFYDFQFGHGINCSNVSAYAPCFGETVLEGLDKSSNYNSVKKGLNNMKAISARDKNTQEIVEALTNMNAPLVLDPTLLYEFKEEKSRWTRKLVEEPYMIIYSWGGSTTTDEFRINVKAFAEKNNLKIVSIGDYRSWCDYNFASATPIEFFELFMHTKMVITNMFHGTCFSLINKKPFYSMSMPHNKNKLEGLLRQFNLESQIILDVNKIGELSIPNINYEEVNSEIENIRGISKIFLKNALE